MRTSTPVLLAGLLLACAAGPASDPSPTAPPAAGTATPIGRSHNPRPGHFTWDLARVVREDGGARVDLRLHNGTRRTKRTILLRLVVLGGAGEWRDQRLPVGALGADRARALSVWIPDVPFRVRDVRLELVYALP